MNENLVEELNDDFADLEKELENNLEIQLSDLEELKKHQAAVENKDSLGKLLMDTVWQQFELQIAAQIGDDFIKENNGLTMDLSDEAHIQTTENFAEGNIAKHNTKIDYQERYDDWQGNLQKDSNGNVVTHQTRVGREEATLVKGARKPFDESRPTGSVEKNTDMDHTVSAGRIIRDPGTNAHLSKEEQIAFANSEENLNEMDSSLNRSKGDLSMDEWLDNPNSKGQKPKEIFNIPDEEEKRLRKKGKEAEAAYKKRIEEGEKKSIELGKQSQKEEAIRAGKGFLKTVAVSLLKDLLKKIFSKFAIWLKSSNRKLKSLFSYLKEAISSFFSDLKKNLSGQLEMSIVTIVEMVLGPIGRLISKVYSFVKQGWSSLKQAYDYITDSGNKEKPIGIMMLELSKIVIAGLSGAGAIALGGYRRSTSGDSHFCC